MDGSGATRQDGRRGQAGNQPPGRACVRPPHVPTNGMPVELPVGELLERGLAHHQAGRLGQAESAYRMVLSHYPDNAHALHLLGVIAHEMGNTEQAIPLIRKAVEIDPAYHQALNNLGNALDEAGRPGEAITEYLRAIELEPGFADALNNLGNAYRKTKQLAEAVAAFERALEIDPGLTLARTNLGNVMIEAGHLETAIEKLEEVTGSNPGHLDAFYNLGIACRQSGQYEKARETLESYIAKDPKRADAHFELGRVFEALGKTMEAQISYRVALDIDPENLEIRDTLGEVLSKMGITDEAIAEFRRCLEIEPNFVGSLNSLGAVLRKNGNYDEGFQHMEKALELDPGNFMTHINLGSAHQTMGNLDEAAAFYQRALEIEPGSLSAEKNFLYSLLNRPGLPSDTLFELHRRVRSRHTRPEAAAKTFPDRSHDPDRRLKVGYVSSDFRSHVVGHNILPVIYNHDHDDLEIFLYSEVEFPDKFTTTFRELGDHWRSIVGKSDPDVAAIIEEDEIDILIFLAGRFDQNRPLIATCRPAPVQVSFHDCATSGLDDMDYWLTDELLHPIDTSEKFTEELYRLPVFYQFPMKKNLPEDEGLPMDRNGYVTFASFNKPEKINDQVVALWARVLKAVPESRLLLKYFNLYSEPSLRGKWIEKFADHGIDASQLILKASADAAKSHLTLVGGVDIALDPFPFNGATTTYEALLMNVPVISLQGKHFVDRVAGSILTHCGHPELVAKTEDDYVELARDLAMDPARLGDLRSRLRHELQASSLCDGEAYTKTVEDAYRDMWWKYCAKEV